MNATAIATDRNMVIESDDRPVTRRSNWNPQWTVDVGDGDVLGVTIDDGCFVVLYPHVDGWRPGSHIPKAAALRIAELTTSGLLD